MIMGVRCGEKTIVDRSRPRLRTKNLRLRNKGFNNPDLLGQSTSFPQANSCRVASAMKKPSSGKCNLCGGTFGKAAMARHIASCNASKPANKAPKTACFHVVVEGGYGNIYWLHLAVPKDDPLSRLH